MMHVVPCDRVRDEIAAYHDGELSIERQVQIQSHLQECVACRLEAVSLHDLSAAFRTMANAVPGRSPAETGLLTGAVLERIRVEEQLSLSAQLRDRFDDMHLVWAGLGATVAMLICVFASAGVLHAASQERPDSLAGIISTIASGTDPVRLAGSASDNSELLDTTEALPAGGEADLMLSAFLTRDGRIQNVAVLDEQARALQVRPDVVLAMVEAASRARFSPAQATTFPGGVNVVWLVTSTTVKGLPDYDLYLLSPPRLSTAPAFGPQQPPKPAPAVDKPATSTSDAAEPA